MTVPFTGGPLHQLRCGLPFQELVDKSVGRTMFGQDAMETLYRLFSACVPCARRVFLGAYRPLRMLHMNDCILEKTFVYGIVALSKCLGEDSFPQGVYGQWPSQIPAGLVPKSQGFGPVDLDAPLADDFSSSTSSPGKCSGFLRKCSGCLGLSGATTDYVACFSRTCIYTCVLRHTAQVACMF